MRIEGGSAGPLRFVGKLPLVKKHPPLLKTAAFFNKSERLIDSRLMPLNAMSCSCILCELRRWKEAAVGIDGMAIAVLCGRLFPGGSKATCLDGENQCDPGRARPARPVLSAPMGLGRTHLASRPASPTKTVAIILTPAW